MAIKLNPESNEAYIGVCISALKLGKYEECIKYIEQRPGQSQDDMSFIYKQNLIKDQSSRIGDSVIKENTSADEKSFGKIQKINNLNFF